jgi:hypothetical protein
LGPDFSFSEILLFTKDYGAHIIWKQVVNWTAIIHNQSQWILHERLKYWYKNITLLAKERSLALCCFSLRYLSFKSSKKTNQHHHGNIVFNVIQVPATIQKELKGQWEL